MNAKELKLGTFYFDNRTLERRLFKIYAKLEKSKNCYEDLYIIKFFGQSSNERYLDNLITTRLSNEDVYVEYTPEKHKAINGYVREYIHSDCPTKALDEKRYYFFDINNTKKYYSEGVCPICKNVVISKNSINKKCDRCSQELIFNKNLEAEKCEI